MEQVTLPTDQAGPRRGTSAVELAVTLPLLLLLVLGCVDYGGVMHESIALENAVSTAANYAASHRFTDYTISTWRERVRDRVIDEMKGVGDFDSDDLVVTVETAKDSQNRVRVTITATYPFQTIVDWPGLPGRILLRHRVAAWQCR